jgi:hypothetical protein
MKKTILTLSLFGLFTAGLTSCEKVKDKLFPAFDTQMADVQVTIPITIQGAESTTNSTVAFNLDSTIKAYTANAFSISNLSSVKVKDIGVFLTDGNDLNNISNFENVTLKFSSNTNSTPAVIIDTPIPNVSVTDINLPVTNSPELKEYLKGNQLTYTVTGRARKTTTKVLHAVILVTLAVK